MPSDINNRSIFQRPSLLGLRVDLNSYRIRPRREHGPPEKSKEDIFELWTFQISPKRNVYKHHNHQSSLNPRSNIHVPKNIPRPMLSANASIALSAFLLKGRLYMYLSNLQYTLLVLLQGCLFVFTEFFHRGHKELRTKE